MLARLSDFSASQTRYVFRTSPTLVPAPTLRPARGYLPAVSPSPLPALACALALLCAVGCGDDAPLPDVTQSAADPAYTLCLTGPAVSESDARNPFLHYRMDVEVDGPEGSYTVPGYFAADGDAANSGARGGDQWCARLRGFAPGVYTYAATLLSGDSVALRQNLLDAAGGDAASTTPETDALGAAGAVGSATGAVAALETLAGAEVLAEARGQISVTAPTDGTAVDGWLRYDTSGFPRFSQSGRYFLKTGTNSPENFLAYSGFDGTYSYDTAKANYVRPYAPHERDARAGDETWGEGRGTGIVGALNYLASIGVNGVYALTNNINGDARDVWPFVSHDTLDRYDVSKLAQWDLVIGAAQARGIHWQFLTQEAENETMLDGGDTGPLRRLYYRELVARFGHHANITWNLGEENGRTPWNEDPFQSDAQRAQMVAWFEANDPYRHPVVIHTLPDPAIQNGVLRPLLGRADLDGLSLQIHHPDQVHATVTERRVQSDSAGRRWMLSMDEIGPWYSGSLSDATDPAHDTLRRGLIWGALTAGCYGVEFYYGWHTDQHDLNADDFRTREGLYGQATAARELLEALPFHTLRPADERVTEGWCLSDGEWLYVVYLPEGGDAELQLGALDPNKAHYETRWHEPKTGAVVAVDSTSYPDNGRYPLRAPDAAQDWVAVVRGHR